MVPEKAWGAAIRNSFGVTVRAVRQQNGISQEELALRTGLDRSYVGQVERGERNLTLENIYKLADGLGVPPASLLIELNQPLNFGPNSAEIGL